MRLFGAGGGVFARCVGLKSSWLDAQQLICTLHAAPNLLLICNLHLTGKHLRRLLSLDILRWNSGVVHVCISISILLVERKNSHHLRDLPVVFSVSSFCIWSNL
mmetsp:Transcript_23758/g.68285  ORF Transcript_23758/g.68285 Transcript_23758/m.68285 type:complete len:104 (+) Transcript_23758:443-754(+)